MTDTSFTDIISKGDTRESLVALRDYVAHELEGNRCPKCAMSQLRTGDTAALVLRLQKIIEDIEKLPPEQDVEAEAAAGVVNLATILNRIDDDDADGASVPEDSRGSKLGSKNAPRRQGGRQPRFRSN